MILVTLLLAIIIGVRNKPTKQKTMRSGRCACNHWCFENHLECPLNSEVWNSFLILSCLSALLPVADSQRVQELKDLQNALEKTEYLFNDRVERGYGIVKGPRFELGSPKKCTTCQSTAHYTNGSDKEIQCHPVHT
ncbi:interleukin-15 isoform X2 [Paramisgurnus dabryanus]|uniref:interleukin-15 isoform X2 n=1 Tax=Paramisgurnus dabryanus TaxID=90735 RepID=UPI003CCFBF8D